MRIWKIQFKRLGSCLRNYVISPKSLIHKLSFQTSQRSRITALPDFHSQFNPRTKLINKYIASLFRNMPRLITNKVLGFINKIDRRFTFYYLPYEQSNESPTRVDPKSLKPFQFPILITPNKQNLVRLPLFGKTSKEFKLSSLTRFPKKLIDLQNPEIFAICNFIKEKKMAGLILGEIVRAIHKECPNLILNIQDKELIMSYIEALDCNWSDYN